MYFRHLEWKQSKRFYAGRGGRFVPPTVNALSEIYDSDTGTGEVITTAAAVGDYTGLTPASFHTGYVVTLTLTNTASGRFSMEAGTHAILVDSTLTVGTYNITVQAVSSDGISATSKIFTIIVVEGLPSLDFSVDSNSQYVPFL